MGKCQLTCRQRRHDHAPDTLVQPAEGKGLGAAAPPRRGVGLEVVLALEAGLDGVEGVHEEVNREGGDGAGLEQLARWRGP